MFVERVGLAIHLLAPVAGVQGPHVDALLVLAQVAHVPKRGIAMRADVRRLEAMHAVDVLVEIVAAGGAVVTVRAGEQGGRGHLNMHWYMRAKRTRTV